MQIKPILARLQSAIGRQDLIEQMVLVPEPRSKSTKSRKTVSFVVGYNGSCNSQTALDMTLWIAHQTRLATQKQVTVHVVYVLDRPSRSTFPSLSGRSTAASDLTACLPRFVESDCVIPNFQAIDPFDHADYVLWQARCMAEEWRGSLEAHLRFGDPAEQLRQVIAAEDADLLLLGCNSARHPLVSQLASLPCPVLGIPCQTHPEEGAIVSPVGSELRA
ncbi:universal stress protein [Microcoleus sp. FACHB-1515]|uniref:universal stress protein n=1 Tax=Cyanophyceae TaxID=3028117 RepID=UPI0028C4CB38|nr:universal stress protein [Microcoleus sp. FACHB-1515]